MSHGNHNNENLEPTPFGPYQVFEQIGAGGMATVHRAQKSGPGGFVREVALKRLLAHLAGDANFVESFIREARLASYLQHINIAQIYDLGQEDQTYYIAMEYVRGCDVRQLLRQCAYQTGPMPISVATGIIVQLLDAMDYAHGAVDENQQALGIIHRDLSPSNLLIATTGHLKVIDFGVAKAQTASLRTNTGRLKGKFSYMSPEVLFGREVDQRSDIFSIGVVAHELFTARPLFSSMTDYEAVRAIRQEEIKPPSYFNPSVPSDVDALVMNALTSDPDKRWQSVGAFRSAMDNAVENLGKRATHTQIASWIQEAFQEPKPTPATETGGAKHLRPLTHEEEKQIDRSWTNEMRLTSEFVVEVSTAVTRSETSVPNTEDIQRPKKRTPWLATTLVVLLLLGAIGAGAWFFLPR